MQECIQELPRRQKKTGKELQVIEQPLEERGLLVGKGMSMQSMAKRTLRSGIRKILEMFLNLPRRVSWNPSATEEDT